MEAQRVRAALLTVRELESLASRTAAPLPTLPPLPELTVVVRHEPVRPYVNRLVRVVDAESLRDTPLGVPTNGRSSDAPDGANATGRMAEDGTLVEAEGEGLRRHAMRAAMELMDSPDTRVALRSVDLALQLLTAATSSRQGTL